jgi:DNA-binding XRE family transcriptional regulator
MNKKKGPVMQSFGSLFKSVRKQDLKLTQRKVAHFLGNSQSNLSKIEAEKLEPSAEQYLILKSLAQENRKSRSKFRKFEKLRAI